MAEPRTYVGRGNRIYCLWSGRCASACEKIDADHVKCPECGRPCAVRRIDIVAHHGPAARAKDGK